MSTDVFEAMQDAGGSEDNSARLDDATLTVAIDFKPALSNKQKFRVGMAMRRMRHHAWLQYCLVHLDELARCEGAFDHRAAASAVRGRMGDELVVWKEL